jgi:FkbH-like protein
VSAPFSREQLAAVCGANDLAKAQSCVRSLLDSGIDRGMLEFAWRQVNQFPAMLELAELRIALLPSFTLEQIEAALSLHMFCHGKRAAIKFWPYQQWHQTLAVPGDLDEFRPDAVVVPLHLEDVVPTIARRHLADNAKTAEELEIFVSGLRSAIRAYRDRASAPVLLTTFVAAERSVERYFDRNMREGRQARIDNLNHRVTEVAAEIENVFVLDYAALVTDFGRRNWFDLVNSHFTKRALTSAANRALAEELSRAVRALFGVRRKVLAVDFDETLWGGIVGEDGVDGIDVFGGYPGNAFSDFQSFLSNLRASGIVLAAVSKNNIEDARQVFERYPDMPIKWSDFASRQINWNDKAQNLRTIAAEIGVSLDSIVFADNSPVECELVRQLLPEVQVVQLDCAPSLFPQRILAQADLDCVYLSREDRHRAESYQVESERRELQAAASNTADFLASLNLDLRIGLATKEDAQRLVQLFNKTNQFNLTTRRYSLQEVLDFIEDPGFGLYTASLKDRFGDYGLIGVVLMQEAGTVREINSLLMSCRVLGRKVEDALIAHVDRTSRERGSRRVIGRYRETGKNNMVADFFLRFGFVETDEQGVYVRDLAASPPMDFPTEINITVKP